MGNRGVGDEAGEVQGLGEPLKGLAGCQDERIHYGGAQRPVGRWFCLSIYLADIYHVGHSGIQE